MNSMLSVTQPKTDQLNADSLLCGAITITIQEVTIRPGTEQPVSILFEGDNGKPYKPCKSMARVMVQCWGPDATQYIGRSMTLYCDPKVMWGGMAVGGIRISHMTHIESTQTMALTATRGNKKPFTVKPLLIEPPIAVAERKAVDKAADGVRDLIKRIQDADGMDALQIITGNSTVIQQRVYLSEKRPELAQRVTEAVTVALALYEGAGVIVDHPVDAS